MAALELERAEQQRLKVWAGRKGARPTKLERAHESDDAVVAEIDDPGLRVVWERVKHKIKATPRKSRAEAFFEWAAENTADVYRIQEADAYEQLEQLEREEARLRRRLEG